MSVCESRKILATLGISEYSKCTILHTCLRTFCNSTPSSFNDDRTFSLSLGSLGNLWSFSLDSTSFWLRIVRRSLRCVICSSRSWTCFWNSASLSRILEVTVEPRRFSRDSFDGTPGNSLGGAELARGGGFSWKQKQNMVKKHKYENYSV